MNGFSAVSEEELDLYFALQDTVGPNEELAIHRLLGHPDPAQGDMQLECQLVTNETRAAV